MRPIAPTLLRAKLAAAKSRAVTGSKGGGKGGGSGKAPRETSDTARSRNIARIVDIISEGETGGLVDGLKSVYLIDQAGNATPVMNADGSRNYQGFEIEERVGLPDQDPLPGFPAVEQEVAVGIEATTTSPVTVVVSDPALDAVRVKVRIPQLFSIDSSGDVIGTHYGYAFDLMPDGGSFATVVSIPDRAAKASNGIEFEHRIELTGSAPWTVRMRRLYPDSASSKIVNKTLFSSYTAVIDAKLKRPNVACVGITADSSEFGDNIMGRVYDSYGIKIQVPANYDFDTRTYLTTGPGTSGGLWDGTFKREISDSHAWHVYNLLVENRYGLGDYLGTLVPDKFAFYDLAQYCDEMVPDGEGGTRPRFTCNIWISTQQQALKLIQELFSGCWASLAPAGGAIVPIADRPATPSKLLTRANVVDGRFDYASPALDEVHSVFMVSFNDPDNGYRVRDAVHEEPDLIAQYGWRPLRVERRDCYSYAEALCHARWLAETEKAGLDKISFAAALKMARGAELADLIPGSVADVADPACAGIRLGGLVSAATTTQVTIDQAVELAAGQSYTLSVVLPDMTVEERTVTTPSGTADVLDLDPALSDTPLAGADWVLSSDAVEPRQFRITAVREKTGIVLEFAGLQHDPDKYDRIFNNLTVPDRSFSILPTGPLQPPASVAASEFLFESGASVLNAVNIGWAKSPDPRVIFYEVEAAEPDSDEFISVGITDDVMTRIDDLALGIWQFRVRGVDGVGRRSAYATTALDVQGKTAKPADVAGFLVTVQGASAQARWDPHTDLDVKVGGNIVFRQTPLTGADATWEAALEIARAPGSATTWTLPILAGTYLAKALDSSGNYSENAVKTEVGSTGFLNFNAVAEQIEDPTFPGDKFDVVIGDAVLNSDAAFFDDIPDFDAVDDLDAYSEQNFGVLQLAGLGQFDDIPDFDAVDDLDSYGGIATEGTYFFSDYVDAGNVYETVRITAIIESRIIAIGATIDNRPGNIDTWENIDGTIVPGSATATLYISGTDDDPAGTPVWGDYAVFVPGDYRGRAFRFKIVLASELPDQNVLVSKLRVTVDMPDRIEAFYDLTTLTTGALRVSYATPFFIAPATAVTPKAMAETERLVLSNEDETGFDVEIFDSGSSRVARAFNSVSKGAGARAA